MFNLHGHCVNNPAICLFFIIEYGSACPARFPSGFPRCLQTNTAILSSNKLRTLPSITCVLTTVIIPSYSICTTRRQITQEFYLATKFDHPVVIVRVVIICLLTAGYTISSLRPYFSSFCMDAVDRFDVPLNMEIISISVMV